MSTKPVSGTGLNSGGAYYSYLTAAKGAVWGMLEGSGGTSSDSSGNGHTLTLDGTVTWSTNGSGDAILACAGASGGGACTVTSPVSFSGTGSWSYAFRAHQTTSGVNGMIAGNEGALGVSPYLWMFGGSQFQYANNSGGSAAFTGVTDFTADHDWLLVWDQPGSLCHLFKDGTEVSGSPISTTSNFGSIIYRSLGSGNSSSDTFALIGTMTYGYLLDGFVGTATDAAYFHNTPYGIFSSPPPPPPTSIVQLSTFKFQAVKRASTY